MSETLMDMSQTMAFITREHARSRLQKELTNTRSFLETHGQPIDSFEELTDYQGLIAIANRFGGFFSIINAGVKDTESSLMRLKDPENNRYYSARVGATNDEKTIRREFTWPLDLWWQYTALITSSTLERGIFQITSPELVERINQKLESAG